MTPSLKHKHSKNNEIRQRDRTSPRQQLALFPDEAAKAYRGSGRKPKAMAIYATESCCKDVGSRRWWNFRCGYNRKLFGGLYSIAERDIILEVFDGRVEPIGLDEFEATAKYAMKAARARGKPYD